MLPVKLCFTFLFFLHRPSSIYPYLYIFEYISLSMLARVPPSPLLVPGQLSPLCGTPTFSPLISSSSYFARVRGARQSVQPSGLKVNAYVIANCLQSLGAALKKDMLRRQLRPLAFASLSDRICFKGLVRIIFNPRALCAPWTAGGGKDSGGAIYAQHEKCMNTVYRIPLALWRARRQLIFIFSGIKHALMDLLTWKHWSSRQSFHWKSVNVHRCVTHGISLKSNDATTL